MDSNQLLRRLDTARNCIHLSAEELQLCWGHNPMYWEMVPNHDTEFPNKIARLNGVCWFDVKGEVVCSLPPGTYTVSWRACLSADARGWESDAVNFTFSKKQDGTEDISRCKCYLKRPRFGVVSTQPEPTIRAVGNGWTEYEVGEFTVEAGERNSALQFAMVATSDDFWKTGLSLDGVVIRPKSLVGVTAPVRLESSSAGVPDEAGVPSNNSMDSNQLLRRLDTARNCIHLSAEELQICWGHNPMYWEMVPNHDTEFPNKIARLNGVCWFDVKGEVVCSLPPGTYTVSWRACLSADARGWESDAVNFTFSKKQDGTEDISRCKCYLKRPRFGVVSTQPEPTIRAVGNGWTEYEVGEFAVEAGERNSALQFAMVATSDDFWKTGLSLDGVVIRPKSLVGVTAPVRLESSSAGVPDEAGVPSNNSMDSNQLLRRLDTARNCIHLSAEELQICWGHNPMYWEMVPNHDTEFPNKIARLNGVCWFDVKGEVVCSLPPGTYTVSWRACLSADARGWESDAVNFTFSKKQDGTEDISRCKCYLKRPRFGVVSTQPEPTIRAVGNGWAEYEVGEFAVEAGERNSALQFAMVATSDDFWKTGLSLDGVVIRPKSLVGVTAPVRLESSSAGVPDEAGVPSNNSMDSNQLLRRLDTARNCIHLSAEELQLCWGHNPMYWEMVPNHDTEFPNKIARLNGVCWFDVKGEVVCSLPPGTYTVSWRACLSADARGWESDAVNFTFSKKQDGTEDISRCKCYLKRPRFGVVSTQPEPTIRAVGNGWTEYEVGEFTVEAGEGNSALQFAMVATSDDFWKTGLSLDGVVIRPKSLVGVTAPVRLESSSAGVPDEAGGSSNSSSVIGLA